MNWKELLARSKYADLTECIVNALEKVNINSFRRLDNAPAKLGSTVCSVSTYELVEELYLVQKTGGSTNGTDDPVDVDIIEIDPIATDEPPVKRKRKEVD